MLNYSLASDAKAPKRLKATEASKILKPPRVAYESLTYLLPCHGEAASVDAFGRSEAVAPERRGRGGEEEEARRLRFSGALKLNPLSVEFAFADFATAVSQLAVIARARNRSI